MGGKSMEPGGGGRFEKLEGELSQEKGIKNPAALAASIGKKKYGEEKMAEFSAKGRHRAARKRGERRVMTFNGPKHGNPPKRNRLRDTAMRKGAMNKAPEPDMASEMMA